jgi:hypothetical protein
MLVELEDASIGPLRDELQGWIVSEQGPRIPVPDTRLKLRPDQG